MPDARRFVNKAYQLKLYPSEDQRVFFMRASGACRWTWNYFLELQQTHYRQTGHFVFRFDMEKMLPALKKQHDWLSIAPSHSLGRVCRNLDKALRCAFKGERRGFPRFKNRSGKRSFYVHNTTCRIVGKKVFLPKIGEVPFRAGRLPEGRILSATILLRASSWYCVVHCAVEIQDAVIAPLSATVIGIDAGLKTLAVMSDGAGASIPRIELRRKRRVKRLQRRLSRCRRGSANREKARRRLAVDQLKLANVSLDCRHKLTHNLVGRASAVIREDLNVAAMARGLHFGASVSAAGISQMFQMIDYKSDWAGKTVVVADRFFPSTQTCSKCGSIKTKGDKIALARRTFRCNDCGHEIDRDLNAAMNLRRYGLDVLGLKDDVGQVMPEQVAIAANACGDSSAGPEALLSVGTGRGSRNRKNVGVTPLVSKMTKGETR